MCGIAGFNLSLESSISPRELSNALLNELDIRGNQASGFAFRSNKSMATYKKAVAGSQLSLKSMSRSAKQVILHTRYATHGSINVYANNHPVESPDGSIALVHNGVIYNHDLVRTAIDPNDLLPEVDTSVIPAILQKYDRNTDKLNMLDGDAAIAWLDRNDTTETMWVARISHSPLQIAQLQDGSFIFASTESILLRALDRLSLTPVYCEPVPERTLLGIRDGRMSVVQAIPELDPAYEDTSWYNYGAYRGMTSGGHSVTAGESCGTNYDYSRDYTRSNTSTPWWEDYSDDYVQTTTASGSDLTPKYVAVQSAWGDILVPTVNRSSKAFPEIDGFTVNNYGEYFVNVTGAYAGDVNDMYESGLISELVFTE